MTKSAEQTNTAKKLSELTILVIFYLLISDAREWRVEGRDTDIERIVHTSGYWYFTGCGGALCIHCGDPSSATQRYIIGLFNWLWLGPIGFINTLMVKWHERNKKRKH